MVLIPIGFEAHTPMIIIPIHGPHSNGNNTYSGAHTPGDTGTYCISIRFAIGLPYQLIAYHTQSCLSNI